jgi:sec-independent protein translocase protein TatC
MISALDPVVHQGHMTIWEHIAELRSRLIRCAIAVLVAGVVGFVLYPYLLELLKIPLDDLNAGRGFITTDPLEPFATRIKISAYTAVVLAMPVLLWQTWRFVTPGLHDHEKRYAVPFVSAALALFVLGAGIAYVTLNPALEFLVSIAGASVEPYYTVDNYVTLIAYMMLAFGLGFEFPVLLVALQLAGILTPAKLRSWWRQAIVIITVVAAVITPSADPISMAALAIPMVLFYGLSIAIGAFLTRGRRQRHHASA